MTTQVKILGLAVIYFVAITAFGAESIVGTELEQLWGTNLVYTAGQVDKKVENGIEQSIEESKKIANGIGGQLANALAEDTVVLMKEWVDSEVANNQAFSIPPVIYFTPSMFGMPTNSYVRSFTIITCNNPTNLPIDEVWCELRNSSDELLATSFKESCSNTLTTIRFTFPDAAIFQSVNSEYKLRFCWDGYVDTEEWIEHNVLGLRLKVLENNTGPYMLQLGQVHHKWRPQMSVVYGLASDSIAQLFDNVEGEIVSATNVLDATIIGRGYLTEEEDPLAAGIASNVVNAAISTNNAAFCDAVRDVPINPNPEDTEELSDYGTYGTIGAAILGLISAVAALKRGKANKVVPSSANNLASLSSSGDLEDSGISATNVTTAVDNIAPDNTGNVALTSVRFGVSQDLTDNQQSQARANIGAQAELKIDNTTGDIYYVWDDGTTPGAPVMTLVEWSGATRADEIKVNEQFTVYGSNLIFKSSIGDSAVIWWDDGEGGEQTAELTVVSSGYSSITFAWPEALADLEAGVEVNVRIVTRGGIEGNPATTNSRPVVVVDTASSPLAETPIISSATWTGAKYTPDIVKVGEPFGVYGEALLFNAALGDTATIRYTQNSQIVTANLTATTSNYACIVFAWPPSIESLLDDTEMTVTIVSRNGVSNAQPTTNTQTVVTASGDNEVPA